MSERLRQEILQELDDAWLNIRVKNSDLIRPLDLLKVEDPDEIYMRFIWLMSCPEYFSFFCKRILNIEIHPFQGLILQELWKRKFPMLVGSRGSGKTFILALYSLLRASFLPERKIVIVGSVFRQSKYMFDYIEGFWKNAPILRDMCDQSSGPRKEPDMYRIMVNGSVITALPVGATGEKIRGQRAHDILVDEFAAHSRSVFENVIAGFAAVSASPLENVKRVAKNEKIKELGLEVKSKEDLVTGNQIVLSGTAYYDFNHFADYFKRWRAIIKSKGDERKLEEIFGQDGVPKNFDWRNYSIIRLPYTVLPKGFMEEDQISRSKATVHAGIFAMEFGSVFCKDSQGFFKRSIIEGCVGREENPIDLPSGPVFFTPSLKGNLNKRYVIGVDPASEIDNFSIVVVEINSDHRRIVYVWTTNKKSHSERVKSGLTSDQNFYTFCARKIRDLMGLFPTARICMDSQGGGVAVREALSDQSLLKEGELPIWEIIEDKEKETDHKAGLHILEMCHFANYEWLCEANHGLRHDFESKVLIFPECDSITFSLSYEEDRAQSRLYDTLEDCMIEIEELKDELALIEQTKTPTGRDKWDTPEVKVSVGKKERMRKDRYSALLMANAGAKAVANTVTQNLFTGYGGFAEALQDKPKFAEFTGPDWFVSQIKGVY